MTTKLRGGLLGSFLFALACATHPGFGTVAAATDVVGPMGVAGGITVTMISPTSPSEYGSSVSLKASVKGPTLPAATGNVSFLVDSVVVGSGNLGASVGGVSLASFTTTALSVAQHHVVARYNGDGVYAAASSPSFSVTVTQAKTTTTVVSSRDPSTAGDVVVFTATVGRQNAGTVNPTTGTVTFRSDGTTIGSGTLNSVGQAALSYAKLAAGTRSISAAYAGDTNFAASSGTHSQTVKVAPTPTPPPPPTPTAVPRSSVVPPVVVVNPAAIATPGPAAASPASTPTSAPIAAPGPAEPPVLGAADGLALAPSVQDNSRVPPFEVLSAVSGIEVGRSLSVGKLLIPINVVALFWVWRALRRGRRLTAIGLGLAS